MPSLLATRVIFWSEFMTKNDSNRCPICKSKDRVVRVGVTSHCAVCDVYWPSDGPQHPIWGPGVDKLQFQETDHGQEA